MSRILGFGFAIGLATVIHVGLPALAQAPAKTFTLTITEEELLYIANVLRQRPFAEVADLLGKMQEQIAQQNVPAATVDPIDEAQE